MKVQAMLLWALMGLGGALYAADVNLDDILNEKKPAAEAKPAEEAKPADEAKPAEEAKPADEAKPAETKPADEAKPADEVKPADQVAEVPKPAPVPEPVVEPKQEGKKSKFSLGHRLLMWLPNLLVDADDIISLQIGIGSKTVCEVRATRYLQFIGSYGDQYFCTKGYSRQYGGGYEGGGSLDLLFGIVESRYVEDVCGTVRPYVLKNQGMHIPTYRMDVYRDDNRDLWEIGAAAGWLVNVEAFVHPVEIADMITGIFLYDLKGDNF